MDRLQAINEMESWADRHGVRLSPYRRCRPGEHRAGLVRVPAGGEVLSPGAMQELVERGRQWTFEEFGPPPASPGAGGSDAGGLGGGSPVSITGDRLTDEVLRGFGVGQGSESSLFVGVDQMTVTGHGEGRRQACLKMLQGYLGEGQAGLYGKNFYREAWLFSCGAMMCFRPGGGRDDWCVVLRGRSLRHVGQERHRQFIIDLWRHSSYATRLDVRLDDYSKEIIKTEDFEDAYVAGNWAGPRKAKRIDERERGRGGECSQTGVGLAFGTRSSARLVAYDKELESQGEICANRLECGYYEDRARLAWDYLGHAAIKSEGDFVRAMGELVTGPVDFVERNGQVHLSRMSRSAFWQRILDAIGWIRLKVEKSSSCLMGTARAIRRQYVRRLARMVVIAESMGEDLYHELFVQIERAREGLELDECPLEPREVGFDPARAFKPWA